MRRASKWTALLGLALLIGGTVPAGASAGNSEDSWQPGAYFDGGPGCDFNHNGTDDGFLDHTGEMPNPTYVPFDYRLKGNLTGDTLQGTYVMRFEDAHYYQNESFPAPDGVPPEILVTGEVSFIGTLTASDFSDIRTLQPLGESALIVWRYELTGVDGTFIARTGGVIRMDLTTGEPDVLSSHGPCEQP